jgi:hypothetical protein
MGQDQHTSFPSAFTSRQQRQRRLGLRVCLRQGCGCVFPARCWNQRYCQDPQCLRLVRRWQAAKRQSRRRQQAEHRQRHREAERQRRERRREQSSSLACPAENGGCESSPAPVAQNAGAWSRSKNFSADFCDRVGCYDSVRPSSRAQARYCGDECRQAMRRVLDRERKWLRRNTDVGRFKRRLEYEQARGRRAAKPGPQAGAGGECVRDAPVAGRRLFGFW